MNSDEMKNMYKYLQNDLFPIWDDNLKVEFVTTNSVYNSEEELSPDILEEAEDIIEKMEKKNILNMIDDALDRSDQKMFMQLWEMYGREGNK